MSHLPTTAGPSNANRLSPLQWLSTKSLSWVSSKSNPVSPSTTLESGDDNRSASAASEEEEDEKRMTMQEIRAAAKLVSSRSISAHTESERLIMCCPSLVDLATAAASSLHIMDPCTARRPVPAGSVLGTSTCDQRGTVPLSSTSHCHDALLCLASSSGVAFRSLSRQI